MQTIHRRSLAAMAITVFLLAAVFAVYRGIRSYWRTAEVTPSPTPANEASSLVPAQDSDSDGLPDAFEQLYRTDDTKADSDGDGTSDFTEIEQGRDPAVAGPNDENKPLTGGDVGADATYTERYLAELPADISRTDILVKERIEAFIELNKGSLLPTVANSSIQQVPGEGKEVVGEYLNRIAPTHNPALHTVTNETIEQALTAQLSLQPQLMSETIKKLEENVATLRAVPTPSETAALHRQLLAASEALLENTRLLAGIDQDFIGSLIGSKKIDELSVIFQDIAQQVAALEAKYSL